MIRRDQLRIKTMPTRLFRKRENPSGISLGSKLPSVQETFTPTNIPEAKDFKVPMVLGANDVDVAISVISQVVSQSCQIPYNVVNAFNRTMVQYESNFNPEAVGWNSTHTAWAGGLWQCISSMRDAVYNRQNEIIRALSSTFQTNYPTSFSRASWKDGILLNYLDYTPGNPDRTTISAIDQVPYGYLAIYSALSAVNRNWIYNARSGWRPRNNSNHYLTLFSEQLHSKYPAYMRSHWGGLAFIGSIYYVSGNDYETFYDLLSSGDFSTLNSKYHWSTHPKRVTTFLKYL